MEVVLKIGPSCDTSMAIILVGMPSVQKMEPVWFGTGQEHSRESANCSKLTFVSPGGRRTGDRPTFSSPFSSLAPSIGFNCLNVGDVDTNALLSCLFKAKHVSSHEAL